MKPPMQAPESIIRPAAQTFLNAAVEHPGDILSGHARVKDLAAVLDGRDAPSLSAGTATKRGRGRRTLPMDIRTATRLVMEYTQPRPDSAVDRALRELRKSVLHWTPPNSTPNAHHSAPPPTARSQ